MIADFEYIRIRREKSWGISYLPIRELF